ncbi:YveK family protein [Risungbinella massiliensis]|uniref:hypothetical protein n=1 Tax=Risungbinella massiliensis TaxID=1329796 RepID=UPI0005CC5225|nr:hypothetical protein [Risungbinella massiliensis]
MEVSKKPFYAFYDYLLFFWRKKSILFAIPVIFIAGSLVVSLFQPTSYEGKANFYVGEKLGDSVDDPEVVTRNLKNKLPVELQSGFQATVPKFKHVQLNIRATDREAGKKALQFAIKNYTEQLNSLYDQKQKLLTNYLDSQSERIKTLEETVELFRNKLNRSNPQELQVLVESEQELTALQEQIHMTKLDLLDFEQQKPQLNDPVSLENVTLVQKSPSYVPNAIIGLLMGLIAAIFALVLWKYLEDAKKNHHYTEK